MPDGVKELTLRAVPSGEMVTVATEPVGHGHHIMMTLTLQIRMEFSPTFIRGRSQRSRVWPRLL